MNDLNTNNSTNKYGVANLTYIKRNFANLSSFRAHQLVGFVLCYLVSCETLRANVYSKYTNKRKFNGVNFKMS